MVARYEVECANLMPVKNLREGEHDPGSSRAGCAARHVA